MLSMCICVLCSCAHVDVCLVSAMCLSLHADAFPSLCDIKYVLCATCYVHAVFLLVFLQSSLFTSAICFSLFVL